MVWHIEERPAAVSTNDLAREFILAQWAAGNSADRQVFVAARQTSGRGQHERRWESPLGGLYFSAILEDAAGAIPAEIHGRLALVAGLAVAEALRGLAPPAAMGLRWPNDLVVAGEPHLKLGGILCEGVAQGRNYAAVIGIGINVNTPAEAFPEGLRLFATSLVLRDRTPRELPVVLRQVLERLEKEWAALVARATLVPVVERWRPLDVLRDKAVVVQTATGRVEGVARGLTDAGDLCLETTGGIVALDHGSIVAVENRAIRS